MYFTDKFRTKFMLSSLNVDYYNNKIPNTTNMYINQIFV